MRLISKNKDVLVVKEDWLDLVWRAWSLLGSPKCSILLAARWWIADVDRMGKANIATLERWLLDKKVSWRRCPFDLWGGGQELEEDCEDMLFDIASVLWHKSACKWYTRIGMLRALRKAAKEPVKTTEELARMWAAEMKLTVEE